MPYVLSRIVPEARKIDRHYLESIKNEELKNAGRSHREIDLDLKYQKIS